MLAALFVFSPLYAADKESFRVACYNIQNWGKTDRKVGGQYLKDAMKPESERKAVLSILKKIDADILAIEEVLRSPDDFYLKMLQEDLKKSGLGYSHCVTVLGEDERIQTALFSRFPVVKKTDLNQDDYEIVSRGKKGVRKDGESLKRKVSRGFIDAVIQVNPSYSVEVMVMHLKSKRPSPEFDTQSEDGEALIRRHEALILRGHMMERFKENPDLNLVVLGDLNDGPNSHAFKTIVGNKDAKVRCFALWLSDYLGDFWTHYFSHEKSYALIDHIIVSKGMFNEFVPQGSFIYREQSGDPAELQWGSASDHRPVTAQFVAKDRKAPVLSQENPAAHE